jgi:hypothetical protein
MNEGICPKCNGTSRRPAGISPYKNSIAGYDAETDTFTCDNCGGQTMYGRATGKVPLRKDNGQPCLHEYNYKKLGNCYHGYTCKHCDYSFNIDSGD